SGFDTTAFSDPPEPAATRARLGIAPEDFVIGTVSRIAPLKGHADLLEAVTGILPSFPRIRILFVGDGSLRPEIEAKTRALNLEKHVIFTGLVPPAEVPRYIGAMDCVAHLSQREALARVLPQALTAGKPILAYEFDGADELCISGETGFLIPIGDTGNVAERLLQLASDPALRHDLGRRGRKLVAERFSIERMVEQQAEVYRRLAKARGIPTQ
ncbi:MAG TPA: glycosyltransferase, partial [Candidatus Paceibacterota bacterium]|nr:glycosyltransferase [Candidatus Paceibacterota bacterium]